MADAVAGKQSFPDIFEQYRGPIRRYVQNLVRDSAEADDIVQETFLRAYHNLSTLQDQTKLSPWLYRIATNLSYDRFRRASRPHRTQSLEDVPETSNGRSEAEMPDLNSPRLDQVIEQKQMSACVQLYLEELSDSYRAVILLHDVEGLSNPEIAAMLDCSLATVKIRLHRARQRLRAALARACDFSQDERGVLVCDPKPPAPDQDLK